VTDNSHGSVEPQIVLCSEEKGNTRYRRQLSSLCVLVASNVCLHSSPFLCCTSLSSIVQNAAAGRKLLGDFRYVRPLISCIARLLGVCVWLCLFFRLRKVASTSVAATRGLIDHLALGRLQRELLWSNEFCECRCSCRCRCRCRVAVVVFLSIVFCSTL
jgi:hypothetical protein